MSETTATSSTERSQDSDSCCMDKDSYPIHCLECIPASSKTNYAAAHICMSNELFVHHPHCSNKAETANYSHESPSLVKPRFPLKGGVVRAYIPSSLVNACYVLLFFLFLASLISEHL